MNHLFQILSIILLFSCDSNNNSDTIINYREVKGIKKTGRFLNTDTIEFKPEESTDYIIIYKDSNELKNIRDSILNHH